MKGIFVTGTDTNVGKTMVCGLLAAFLRERGMNAVTQKWVQTGTQGWPADLAMHRRLMKLPQDIPEDMLGDLCPYRFSYPASPHLAAEREGKRIDVSVIEAAYRRLERSHDAVVVEGVGGFLVPLSQEMLLGDLVARLGLPVLIVVGNRLGAINLALLTVEAVRRREIPLAGLVFNRPPGGVDWCPEELLADNIRVIAEIAKAPVLGEVPFLSRPDADAEAFEPVGQAFLERWRTA
ncbi:MAG: dethiobiotin synthase [Thermodesulfobacteriota bacterium]